MKKEVKYKYRIKLNAFQLKVLINVVNRYKHDNNLENESRTYVNNILLKMLDAYDRV